MSDLAYSIVRTIGRPAFITSASPVRLHLERLKTPGGILVAPTHLSPFDVPCLIADSPRHLDFMSVTEFQKVFFVGRLFTAMNCLFLDRGRVDATTVRHAVEKLKAGRAVVMFPEGHIREWPASVVHGKPFKPGIARLAMLADAPIVPVVVLGTWAYIKVKPWLPFRRTKYGINVGEPIRRNPSLDDDEAEADLVARLAAAYVSLYAEIRPLLPERACPALPAATGG